MKTGLIITLIGILSVFVAALYSSVHVDQNLNMDLLAIFGAIWAGFGFLIMQFNGTRARVPKTQKIIGLLFGVVGITFVILFVAAPVGFIFCLCFVVLLFALMFSGVSIPEPFV